MSEKITLNAQKREAMGKGAGRKLRAEGKVPAVFYNAKGLNIPLTLSEMALKKAYQKVGTTSVLSLVIDDNGSSSTEPALFWKMHQHPFKNRLLHVDFFGVDLTKEIKVVVPIETVGLSPAVKQGAILEVYRDRIEVLCLPEAIPHSIQIDTTPMQLNDSISVDQLELPEGVKALYDDVFTVVSVAVARAIEEEEEGEGEGEEGEGEEGTEEEAAEE